MVNEDFGACAQRKTLSEATSGYNEKQSQDYLILSLEKEKLMLQKIEIPVKINFIDSGNWF